MIPFTMITIVITNIYVFYKFREINNTKNISDNSNGEENKKFESGVY